LRNPKIFLFVQLCEINDAKVEEIGYNIINKEGDTLVIREIQSDDGFLMSPKIDFVFKLLFGDEKNKDI
jgi:hypothetical protein